jgi:hypothetical protein
MAVTKKIKNQTSFSMTEKEFGKVMDALYASHHKKYEVTYNDKFEMNLNPELIDKQGLTDKECKHIVKLHISRCKLFDKMKQENNVRVLRRYVKDLTQIEFDLQKAWKFKKDARFHSWWFLSPKCTCPKLDNWDSLGTGYHVISEECILHGKQHKK